MFLKDPSAVLVHTIVWDAGYLGARSISASQWSVFPAAGDFALVAEEPQIDGGETRARLAGGQAGHVYRVTNRITMSDGCTDERTLLVRVEDR
jgi:hypothetical protein